MLNVRFVQKTRTSGTWYLVHVLFVYVEFAIDITKTDFICMAFAYHTQIHNIWYQVYNKGKQIRNAPLRSLYFTKWLLSTIKCRSRGTWCGPRVIPVLQEGMFRKMPKTLLYTPIVSLTLSRTTPPPPPPIPIYIYMNYVWKKTSFFSWADLTKRQMINYFPISSLYPRL